MQREDWVVSAVNVIYPNAKKLSKILKLTQMLRDEVNVTFDGEGMSYKCIDSSHIAIVMVKIPMTTNLSGASIEVPLNLDEMVEKVFQKVDDGDEVSFGIDVKAKKLLVMFRGGVEKYYCLKFEDPIHTEFPEPKFYFPSSLTIESKVLHDIFKELGSVSDVATIIAKEGKFTFSTESGDMTNLISVSRGSKGVIRVDADAEIRSMYALSYLTPIVRQMANIAKEVELRIGDTAPLMLRIQPGEGEVVEYYLAPRVPDY
jgi:DNA polymerase III sliding clamp (beta) subunit (PCNA family)